MAINGISFKVCQDFSRFSLCRCRITHQAPGGRHPRYSSSQEPVGLEAGTKGFLSFGLSQVDFGSLRKALEPRTKAVQTLSVSFSLCISVSVSGSLGVRLSLSFIISFPIYSTKNP